MLEYNEIKPKKFIVLDGTPYEVLYSHVFRKQQRKPVNQTKLKNLMSGKVTERSFGSNESAEEADLEIKDVKFIYENKGEYCFCFPNHPSKRFFIEPEKLGDQAKFLKANSMLEVVYFGDQIVSIRLPIKLDFKVTEAPPNIKGNTAQGGNKQVTLETGAVVSVPMFVNEGDVVRINTETGEYTERV